MINVGSDYRFAMDHFTNDVTHCCICLDCHYVNRSVIHVYRYMYTSRGYPPRTHYHRFCNMHRLIQYADKG